MEKISVLSQNIWNIIKDKISDSSAGERTMGNPQGRLIPQG